ncbi:general stress protein [Thalassobacillus sp. C254]|uniref:general stress protein n=1 Tax=Thalassobacillus sp. C254 TaxID=1225341 RepID=UPI0006D1D39B|nr:general stress protein [Thalassobacillus sp. C254]
MAERVIGVYEKEQEVITAVEELKKEGLAPSDMSLAVDEKTDASYLMRETGVQTETEKTTEASEGNNKGMLDKLKQAFTGNDQQSNETSGNVKEKFISMGMTEEEATEYKDQIKEGKMVLFVTRDADESLGGPIGHTTKPTSTDRPPLMGSTSSERETEGSSMKTEETPVETEGTPNKPAKPKRSYATQGTSDPAPEGSSPPHSKSEPVASEDENRNK